MLIIYETSGLIFYYRYTPILWLLFIENASQTCIIKLKNDTTLKLT